MKKEPIPPLAYQTRYTCYGMFEGRVDRLRCGKNKVYFTWSVHKDGGWMSKDETLDIDHPLVLKSSIEANGLSPLDEQELAGVICAKLKIEPGVKSLTFTLRHGDQAISKNVIRWSEEERKFF